MRLRASSLAARGLSTLILTLATLLGGIAFLYPFFLPQRSSPTQSFMAHSADAPFTFLILLFLCLVVVIANLETRQMDSKLIAVLGILVAINASLRLIPGPAGFTAMLFLPILCGYSFGPDFGFLLGALSMLVSAIITGGMGP
ncbi:MAG: ECF transporter S component, partial [Anaerolineae bacterium]|nr:ECF transporter S component [Anaerolineae bacterium]